MSKFLFFVTSLSVILSYVPPSSGHGRLISPPSRSSAWRYKFNTPPNYNDHEIYCGGFARQWQRNGGKCGVCGDPWDAPQPRANEGGGKYGLGVIVGVYQEGAEVEVGVELTASHRGYFEFNICPHNNKKKPTTQECLDKYLLQRTDGEGARYFPDTARKYSMRYNLPKGVTCEQCVFQWRYVAGNNWGRCSNGTGMVGCGPQEEFRSCADIQIIRSDGTADNTPNVVPEYDTSDEKEVDDDSDDYNEIDTDNYPKDGDKVTATDESNTGRIIGITFVVLLFIAILVIAILWFFLPRDTTRRFMDKRMGMINKYKSNFRREKKIHPVSGYCNRTSQDVKHVSPLAFVSAPPIAPPRRNRKNSLTASPDRPVQILPTPSIPIPSIIVQPKPWNSGMLDAVIPIPSNSLDILKKPSEDLTTENTKTVDDGELALSLGRELACVPEENLKSVCSSSTVSFETSDEYVHSTDSEGDGVRNPLPDISSNECQECGEIFSNGFFLKAHLISIHNIYEKAFIDLVEEE